MEVPTTNVNGAIIKRTRGIYLGLIHVVQHLPYLNIRNVALNEKARHPAGWNVTLVDKHESHEKVGDEAWEILLVGKPALRKRLLTKGECTF
jgi:hypothetical protein